MVGLSDATHTIIIPSSNSKEWDFLRWMKFYPYFFFLIIRCYSVHQERMCTISGPSSQRFYSPPPEYKCIYHLGLIWLTQRCNSDIWLVKNIYMCVMRIVRKSRYAFAMRFWFNDLNFNCSTGYFICSISTWNYFPLFLCLIHLALLRFLIPIW